MSIGLCILEILIKKDEFPGSFDTFISNWESTIIIFDAMKNKTDWNKSKKCL